MGDPDAFMKSPAFQFYPSDWLGSQRVALMTLEEEGAYIRALAFCWGQGGVPADPQKLAFLIGKGASTTVGTTVAAMFEPDPNRPGWLFSPRMEEVRAKQAEWREKSIEGGKKSGEARKLKGGSTTVGTKDEPPLNHGSTTVQPPFEPKGNPPVSCLLSPSPIPISLSNSHSNGIGSAIAPPSAPKPPKPMKQVFTPPTQAEMELHAAKIGLPPSEIEGFFHYYEANGWKVGRNPMKSWSAAMVNWKLNHERNSSTRCGHHRQTEAERRRDMADHTKNGGKSDDPNDPIPFC